jgi:PAS domain S-box-containing protein
MISDADLFTARILVVDDKPANVRLLEQMLGAAGYLAVSSTCDSQQVCRLHRENCYDLILLDLMMPGMDGFDVLEALAAMGPEAYVPVLVVTAQPAHKLRALQAGARDFVGKPFDLVEMTARIRNLLEVRLLHRQVTLNNERLERLVQERTAELKASEERFQRFTELSSDWYWEQDAGGRHTRVSGPALEMLGLGEGEDQGLQWNEKERAALRDNIAARRPFLDLICSRVDLDGSQRFFQVSGEPFFGQSGTYAGYRGIGMDVTERMRR